MLHNLQKIGEEQLRQRGAYDAFVWPVEPLLNTKKTPVVVELQLDLDTAVTEESTADQLPTGITKRTHDTDGIDEERLWNWGGVRMTGGPNGRSHYFAVRGKNLKNLYKSLFGKDGNGSELRDWCGSDLSADLVVLLNDLRKLEPALLDLLGGEVKDDEPTFKDSALAGRLGIPNTNQLVLVFLSIKSSEHGIAEFTPMAQLGNYQELYRTKMSIATDENAKTALCYLTGTAKPGAELPDYEGRYNLNKTFITETVNYAPGFEKKRYADNFRLSPEATRTLDAASEYLLNYQRVSIAGVSHVLIPHVLGEETPDPEDLRIKAVSDLVFSTQKIDEVAEASADAALDDEQPYWLTFLAYDSNGNFFKIVNQIQEVPSFYFRRIGKAIRNINRYANAGNSAIGFSLYTVFQSIPLVGAGSRNEALELLKLILEGRSVDEELLWKYCGRLLLAHRYARYKKHPNLYEPYKGKKERPETVADAGYANAVRAYTQLRLLLGQLDLLPHFSITLHQILSMQLEQRFEQLGYTERQRGLFQLGRALGQMAYAQFKRGNSKRIVGKVNFNGMDARSLMQLHNDLADTARVYKATEGGNDSLLDKISWNLDAFNARFDPNTWEQDHDTQGRRVSPQAALYYLMAGYSYKPPRPDKNDDEPTDTPATTA